MHASSACLVGAVWGRRHLVMWPVGSLFTGMCERFRYKHNRSRAQQGARALQLNVDVKHFCSSKRVHGYPSDAAPKRRFPRAERPLSLVRCAQDWKAGHGVCWWGSLMLVREVDARALTKQLTNRHPEELPFAPNCSPSQGM